MKPAVTITVILAAAAAGAGRGHDEKPVGTAAEILEAATTLVERRQPEEAVGLLDYGLGIYPLDVELNIFNVYLVTEQGLEDLARGTYDQRLAEAGEEPVLLWARGKLAGNDAETRSYYDRALKADGGFVPARLGLAELALKAGDRDGAEKEVAAALKADPSSRRAYGFRGVIRQRRGELEEAVDDFNRALKGEPYAPATHAALAQTYYLLGNYEAAAEEYRAAVALNGDRGAYYLGLGRALEGIGAVDAARLNYVIAAEKAEGDVGVAAAALKNGGRLAYLMGELDQAETSLESATALAPGDGDAYGELGIVYMMEQRPADAAAAFETAAANEPSRADWWFYLGVCRNDGGDFAGAEAALLKARDALAAYHRPDDKVTAENVEDVLAAVRAARASLDK